MRFVVGLAGCAPLLVFACSDGPDAQPDGGAPDVVVPDVLESSAIDSGADTTHSDAPVDAPIDACATPEDPDTSDRCTVVGSCSTCTAGTLYRCDGTRQRPRRALGARKFAPLEKTFFVQQATPTADYCGPPACVRAAAEDSTCIPNSRELAVRCPAKADGDSAVPIPSFCSYVGPLKPGEASIRMCCADIDPP